MREIEVGGGGGGGGGGLPAVNVATTALQLSDTLKVNVPVYDPAEETIADSFAPGEPDGFCCVGRSLSLRMRRPHSSRRERGRPDCRCRAAQEECFNPASPIGDGFPTCVSSTRRACMSATTSVSECGLQPFW